MCVLNTQICVCGSFILSSTTRQTSKKPSYDSPCSIKCFSIYLNCRKYFTDKCLTSLSVHSRMLSLSHTNILLRFTKRWCIEKQCVQGWVEIRGEKANFRGNVLHHSNEPITTFLHPIKSLAPFPTFMTLRGQHTSSFATVNLCFSLYLPVYPTVSRARSL